MKLGNGYSEFTLQIGKLCVLVGASSLLLNCSDFTHSVGYKGVKSNNYLSVIVNIQ